MHRINVVGACGIPVLCKVRVKGESGVLFCEDVYADKHFIYLRNVILKKTLYGTKPGQYKIKFMDPRKIPDSCKENFYTDVIQAPSITVGVTYGENIPLITIPKDSLVKIVSYDDLSELPEEYQVDLGEAKVKLKEMIGSGDQWIQLEKNWEYVKENLIHTYDKYEREVHIQQVTKDCNKSYASMPWYLRWCVDINSFISEKLEVFEVNTKEYGEYLETLRKQILPKEVGG